MADNINQVGNFIINNNNNNNNQVDTYLVDAYFNSIPPGYRFWPTDEELLVNYLAKKVKNEPLPLNKIHEVDIYQYHPQALTDMYKLQREEQWYFFTPRERKYPKGERPTRKAGQGFWKPTGCKVQFDISKDQLGFRHSLDYYEGGHPKGNKTEWKMHEYIIKAKDATRKRVINGMRLDEWVLCKLYIHKNSKEKKKNGEGESESGSDPQTNSSSPQSENNPSPSSNIYLENNHFYGAHFSATPSNNNMAASNFTSYDQSQPHNHFNGAHISATPSNYNNMGSSNFTAYDQNQPHNYFNGVSTSATSSYNMMDASNFTSYDQNQPHNHFNGAPISATPSNNNMAASNFTAYDQNQPHNYFNGASTSATPSKNMMAASSFTSYVQNQPHYLGSQEISNFNNPARNGNGMAWSMDNNNVIYDVSPLARLDPFNHVNNIAPMNLVDMSVNADIYDQSSLLTQEFQSCGLQSTPGSYEPANEEFDQLLNDFVQNYLQEDNEVKPDIDSGSTGDNTVEKIQTTNSPQ